MKIRLYDRNASTLKTVFDLMHFEEAYRQVCCKWDADAGNRTYTVVHRHQLVVHLTLTGTTWREHYFQDNFKIFKNKERRIGF